MNKNILVFLFLLFSLKIVAQDSVITVSLIKLARDERFDKFTLVLPVFLAMTDTALTMDFEGLRKANKYHFKKPFGYNSYGYGYTFFSGNENKLNPGFVNLLFAGIYDRHTDLFIDRNNNFDFTDDRNKYPLPKKINDSLLINVYRNDDSLAGITIRLKKMDYTYQPDLRKKMNDYYAYYYKDRELAGIDYCYREQRYITKCGVVKTKNDSFLIALYDGNCNGYYNDADFDKILTANFNDTLFNSIDDLHSFLISKNNQFIDFNGEQFEVLEIGKHGNFITLKQLANAANYEGIKIGKKIPKFKFTSWTGERLKIKKFKKYDVYIYFTGANVKNFGKDTASLRKIADAYPEKLKVISFMDVHKSYELKVFGMYSNLNYISSLKEKDIVKKLMIRGLPSSLWIRKRRKVVRYNLTPEEFLKEYNSDSKRTK